MPIQFRCPGCSQPIEVDDQFGGQSAQCPYCHRVITVPAQTSLEPIVAAAARPAAGASEPPPPPPPPWTPAGHAPPPVSNYGAGGLHVGAGPTRRELAARKTGNAALVCTVLAILMFVAQVVVLVSTLGGELLKHPGSQPAPEDFQRMLENSQAGAWPMILGWGMTLTVVLGAILAVVSLIQSRSGNWRAILSLIVCGLFLVCTCAGVFFSLAGRGMPA